MKYGRVSGTIIVLLLLAANIFAHDYWIEPETFFLTTGSSVNVRLYLGDHFVSEGERPYKLSSTAAFRLFSAGEEQDLFVTTKDGAQPITHLKPSRGGNYLLALERKPQLISLAAPKFTSYLQEEGLEAVIAERERLGESATLGREAYSRYLKSLLLVGNQPDDTFKRIVGHKLEISLQKNPYQMKVGESLPLRVLFEGKPLARAAVYAHNRSNGKVHSQKSRTDDNGEATFTLDRSGQWIIRLVHMRRCVRCEKADWESFWTSFTFGMK